MILKRCLLKVLNQRFTSLYSEDDFLQLSGIQHFAFCRRQWALVHIELQWQENVRTIEGRLLHDKAHDNTLVEKRGDLIISRAMPVKSRELGASGECDIVEFHRSEEGISLAGQEGSYKVVPVEYKRGKPKEDEVDILQLAAQAMCLEEMLCCDISEAYLYYGEIRRRQKVEITADLRKRVTAMFLEMHEYFDKRYTPKVKTRKSCNACSLKDTCLPVLNRQKSVKDYISSAISED